MKKYSFKPNIWLTFQFNNKFHIGKTMLENELEIVASVSEDGNISFILYSKINNPHQLKILKNEKLLESKNFKRDIDLDISTN